MMDELDYTKPTEEFLRSIDVHELLPQQEPFVMISCLTQFDMLCTVTETTITENNIFVDNGCFTASGLIENIAQTCAARIGYVNKYILKKGIQIGFIGAIRNLQIHDLPKVNDTITTTVDVQEEIFGMTLANSTVQLGKNILVTAEMKIALKNDGTEG
jgi:predicted hotdog family 3-hydroxylacyl-ACP dehydratase